MTKASVNSRVEQINNAKILQLSYLVNQAQKH